MQQDLLGPIVVGFVTGVSGAITAFLLSRWSRLQALVLFVGAVLVLALGALAAGAALAALYLGFLVLSAMVAGL